MSLNFDPSMAFTNGDFQKIKAVYDFATEQMSGDFHIVHDNFPSSLWNSLNEFSPLFPEIQRQRLSKSFDEDMAAFPINLNPIKSRKFQLSHPKGHYCDLVSTATSTNSQLYSPSGLQKNTSLMQYNMMSRIVKWIVEHTDVKHKVHITSYRHMQLKELMRGEEPCIYCMALSLWYFHLASRKYSPQYHFNAKDYPFFHQLNYQGMADVRLMNSIHHNEQYYEVDEAFTSWSYCRSLELLFVEITNFLKFLFERINFHRDNEYCWHSMENHYQRITSSEFDYFADKEKDKLVIYYENEHPIEQIEIQRSSSPHKKCRNYHVYHKNIFTSDMHFDYSFTANKFDYDNYLRLCDDFESFLDTKLIDFSPGSSPIKY